jgi:nucleoside-diphosphate-sugar epimerase
MRVLITGRAGFIGSHTVDANILGLQDSRADYQTFNVGGDRRVTVPELAATQKCLVGPNGA